MIKVLIVDDSAFMRNALANMLATDPEIKVIGAARDGVEAVDKTLELKPDLVTMDVEMPRMDGIEALRLIMDKCPVPVIMVSSLTTEGAKATLDALDYGAVDFIPKNLSELSLNIVKIKAMLIEKVKQIARKGLVKRRMDASQMPIAPRAEALSTGDRRTGIVAIGASTGGPRALQDILPRLPKDFPVPVVIAQHMPQTFTGLFAERMNNMSEIAIKEAVSGEPLKAGVVYIAPGGGHMQVVRKRGIEPVLDIVENRDDFIYRPSVDHLMLSVAEAYPGRSLGVILTGMGADGLRGIRAMKEGGGRVFAQSEETCVVYGMPRVVVEADLADKVLSVDELAGEIMNAV